MPVVIGSSQMQLTVMPSALSSTASEGIRSVTLSLFVGNDMRGGTSHATCGTYNENTQAFNGTVERLGRHRLPPDVLLRNVRARGVHYFSN